MKSIDEAEAQARLAEILEEAQRQPIVIRRWRAQCHQGINERIKRRFHLHLRAGLLVEERERLLHVLRSAVHIIDIWLQRWINWNTVKLVQRIRAPFQVVVCDVVPHVMNGGAEGRVREPI